VNSGTATTDSISISVLGGAADQQVPAVVDTLNLVFPSTPRSIKTFVWKHYDNPQGASIITYASDSTSGKVVGVRAFWRCNLNCNNKSVVAYQPCDTATHPEFRRYGLFTRMTRLAIDEAERKGTRILFNFPNAQSKPAYLKLQWKETSEMLMLLRPVSYIRALIHGLGMRDPGKRRFVASPEAALSQQWSQVEYPGAEELLCSSNTYYSVPDEEYVNWRYRHHPHIQYGLAHEEGTSIVYRSGCRGFLKELQLVQVIDRRNSAAPGVVARLVKRVAMLERADIVTAVLSRSNPIASALSKAGFFQVPSRAALVYRGIDGGGDGDPLPAFSVFAGDLDTF
jgi:hypothetical protein